MSIRTQIGHLSKITYDGPMKLRIEWTIGDIFSYTGEDRHYNGPRFSVEDSRWCLRIYLNGKSSPTDNLVGWISLYLRRVGDTRSPIGANYSFGVKRAGGVVEQIGKDLSWIFYDDCAAFGRHKFLERCELLRRRSELAPSDVLTLTCSLRLTGSIFCSISTLDTLSSNLTDLFFSKRCCDATLKVQYQEFPVHRCILSARSPVFEAMFRADMREKQTGVVDIVDCDPGAFRDFLLFLYTGKFRIDSNKVFEIYKIAHKYCVVELRSACVLHMMGYLSLENFCDVTLLGHQFDDESLQERTKLFFNGNFAKIICTDSWKSLLEGANSDLANQLLNQY